MRRDTRTGETQIVLTWLLYNLPSVAQIPDSRRRRHFDEYVGASTRVQRYSCPLLSAASQR